MRKKLMIQSLSPLALLTIVRNFSFVTRDETGTCLTSTMFWEYNKILLIVMAVCVIWIWTIVNKVDTIYKEKVPSTAA